MAFPLVEVTSGPSPTATVFASMNDDEGTVRLVKSIGSAKSTFDLGYADTDSDKRQVEMTVHAIMPTTRTVAISAFSEIARALGGGDRWLHVKLSHAEPSTWYQIDPDPESRTGSLDLSRVYLDDLTDSVWSWDLSVQCVGPGYGEEVTLDPITITNLELGAVLPEIEGDAPSLAKVTVKPGASLVWSYWESLISVVPVLPSCSLGSPAGVSVATPIPAVVQWEAESFTLAGDASTTTSSALSGNSGVVIPEANTAWRQVLFGAVPVKPPPGRYAVYARVSRGAHAGKMRFRLGHFGWEMGSTLTDVAPLYAPVGSVADSAWMPLGELSFPAGQPFSGLVESQIVTPSIQLYAKGLAQGGGSNIIVDRFALVPVELAQGGEARTRRGLWGINAPQSPGPLWNSWCIDGLRRRDGLVAYDGAWYSTAQPPQPQGGYLEVHPGMRNVVTVLPKVHNGKGGGPGVETLSDSLEVTVSYHPRVRHMVAS